MNTNVCVCVLCVSLCLSARLYVSNCLVVVGGGGGGGVLCLVVMSYSQQDHVNCQHLLQTVTTCDILTGKLAAPALYVKFTSISCG